MKMKFIPHLDLAIGQVAWILSFGKTATNQTLDQLRYLRSVGIPFTKEELGGGRGNRLRYSYYHLIETGVALFSMNLNIKPRNIATPVSMR